MWTRQKPAKKEAVEASAAFGLGTGLFVGGGIGAYVGTQQAKKQAVQNKLLADAERRFEIKLNELLDKQTLDFNQRITNLFYAPLDKTVELKLHQPHNF